MPPHSLMFVRLCIFIKCAFVYFTVCAVSVEVYISYSLPRLADISWGFNFEVSDNEEMATCNSTG